VPPVSTLTKVAAEAAVVMATNTVPRAHLRIRDFIDDSSIE